MRDRITFNRFGSKARSKGTYHGFKIKKLQDKIRIQEECFSNPIQIKILSVNLLEQTPNIKRNFEDKL